MSWRATSRDVLARMVPVRCPTVNRRIKPRANNMDGDHLVFPPWRVASHLTIFTSVGMAIIIVADVKYACVNISYWEHMVNSYDKA